MVLCDRSFRRYVVFLCRSCYVNRKSFSIFQVQKWLKTNGFEFIYLGLSLTSVVEIVPFFFFFPWALLFGRVFLRIVVASREKGRTPPCPREFRFKLRTRCSVLDRSGDLKRLCLLSEEGIY